MEYLLIHLIHAFWVSVPAVEIEVSEELPLLRADAGLLERALANRVENAVRHGLAGRREGTITIYSHSVGTTC